MPTHGSLSKAGKVRSQTPKIQAQTKTAPSPKNRNRRNYEKLGLSGFYTVCKDSKGTTGTTYSSTTTPNNTTIATSTPANVDYSGYLLRLKGESGPVMGWIDYNRTTDKTPVHDVTFKNIFVWAQYKVNVHESATGTFSVTPTIRYRASGRDIAGTTVTDHNNQLRTELWASVTF